MESEERCAAVGVKEALSSNRGRIFKKLLVLSVLFAVLSILGTACLYLANGGYLPSIPFVFLLNLAGERNLAAWGSGALLFLAGLILIGNRRSLDAGDRWANLGYLGLGSILIGLSADEVGSIHERINYIKPVIGFLEETNAELQGSLQQMTDSILWEAPRLFFFILLFALVAGQAFLLWRDRTARRYLGLVGLAFALFLLVYLQEKVQNHINLTKVELSVVGKMSS